MAFIFKEHCVLLRTLSFGEDLREQSLTHNLLDNSSNHARGNLVTSLVRQVRGCECLFVVTVCLFTTQPRGSAVSISVISFPGLVNV